MDENERMQWAVAAGLFGQCCANEQRAQTQEQAERNQVTGKKQWCSSSSRLITSSYYSVEQSSHPDILRESSPFGLSSAVDGVGLGDDAANHKAVSTIS